MYLKIISQSTPPTLQYIFKEPEEFVDPKPKDNKDLLKEIELLKAENAYLKKLRALVQERIARESKKGLPPSKN